MGGPLNNVRVIEICSAISGPFAGKLLGDLGADVIKVETPGNGAADRTRDLPYDRHSNEEFTWRFLNYNTNKESIAVDLKTDRGVEILGDLLDDADVLLENMRPGSMERLGFGWEKLRERNPELIYCSIKGYGADGPYTDLPALDTLIQGVSGFATQVGKSEGPEPIEILVADMMTGMYAAWSITAALFERHTSGRGQRVDISMLDATISMLGHQLAEYTAGQRHEDFKTEYGSRFAPKGFYETADGYVSLFIGEDWWEEFCIVLDQPDWTDPDHPYGTNDKRLRNQMELRKDIEAILAEKPTDDWMAYFNECEETVLAAPVNAMDDVPEDPQVRAQEAVTKRTHPEMGEYYTPNVVPKFSRTEGSISDAPSLGDATDRVLKRLGYSADERAALREGDVIE
jgi:crotonobetainyl-CoA:carnitine CoA-transferase CaiB-like acyl-CoA transferase